MTWQELGPMAIGEMWRSHPESQLGWGRVGQSLRPVIFEKFILSSFELDAGFEQISEVAIGQASLAHPNLATVLGFERSSTGVTVYSDFGHGAPMSIQRDPVPLEPLSAVRLSIGAFLALGSVHRLSFVHGRIGEDYLIQRDEGVTLMGVVSPFRLHHEHQGFTPEGDVADVGALLLKWLLGGSYGSEPLVQQVDRIGGLTRGLQTFLRSLVADDPQLRPGATAAALTLAQSAEAVALLEPPPYVAGPVRTPIEFSPHIEDPLLFSGEPAGLVVRSPRDTRQKVPEIEGYTDLVVIGSGEAGRFRATNISTQRRVDLELLIVGGGNRGGRSEVDRVRGVMTALAGHPNVAQLIATCTTTDGTPVVVTSATTGLLEVSDLDRLDSAALLSMVIALCGALETMHQKGYFHRGIRPDVIALTDRGEPVIGGFRTAANDSRIDFAPSDAGPYIAPELLRTGSVVNLAVADVYALTASAYALLAGHAPYEAFRGEAMAAVALRALKGEPVQALRSVPASLDAALRRALDIDPARRPSSALEFAESLKSVQADLGLDVTEPVVPDQNGSLRRAVVVAERKNLPREISIEAQRSSLVPLNVEVPD